MSKTVLIADDDADVVDLLARHCRKLGLQVVSADNAMTALSAAEHNVPDAVILDVDMPRGNGLSVCEMMADHETLRSIPIIILTASSSHETVRRCHQLCAYYVLKSPNVWPRIEPILRELFDLDDASATGASEETKSEPDADGTGGPDDLMDTVFAVLGVEKDNSFMGDELDEPQQWTEKPWVLSIEDDDDFALAMRLRLQELGIQVIRAAAGMEGYRRAFIEAPRAIVLDYELPQGNGDYVLRRLKESPATCDIPVIVLTGRRDASIERQMRALGASEFLTKPLDWTRLRSALQVNLEEFRSVSHI